MQQPEPTDSPDPAALRDLAATLRALAKEADRESTLCYGSEFQDGKAEAFAEAAANADALLAALAPAPAGTARDERPVCGKTADGVEARMGDPVWYVHHRRGVPPQKWYAAPDGCAILDRRGHSTLLDEVFYSTEAAARKASDDRDAMLGRLSPVPRPEK